MSNQYIIEKIKEITEPENEINTLVEKIFYKKMVLRQIYNLIYNF